MTILAVFIMLSLEPWPPEVWRARGIWPVVPARPAELRPAPTRVTLPRASAGRDGPATPTPRVAPTVPAAPPRTQTRSAAGIAARQASRQRYLDNVYLLGQLIHGEARGEPYMGQVAVGAVVMNRLESPLFPKTLASVVFEPGAFDAVIDGQIYLPPDREAIKAAQDAIAGWDPTGGALFYYNPAKTTSYWIWNRPIILVIGRHYFAR